MDRLIGRIKWFSRRRNEGALTNIGGNNLDFSSMAEGTTPFVKGQLVTYTAGENGATTPYAEDVRPQRD
jgi:hypothetical protein